MIYKHNWSIPGAGIETQERRRQRRWVSVVTQRRSVLAVATATSERRKRRVGF